MNSFYAVNIKPGDNFSKILIDEFSSINFLSTFDFFTGFT